MKDKLKTAFDSVHAEDSLKQNTMQYLSQKIQKGSIKKQRHNRLTLTFASIAAVLIFSVFSYRSYFTVHAYVDMDVNPSVELVLNRFDRVIDTYAYNAEARKVLKDVSIKHKKYSEAFEILLNAYDQNGYMKEDGMVAVTLQTDNKSVENSLLRNIKSSVTTVASHHHASQVDVSLVDSETRHLSHQYSISPAKYLAILDLIKVDPAASIEGCKDDSIGEIKQQTHSHSNNHNSDTQNDDHKNDSNESDSHHGGNHD